MSLPHPFRPLSVRRLRTGAGKPFSFRPSPVEELESRFAPAAISWNGAGVDWAAGANWDGGVAPADSVTTDSAFFNLPVYGNQPNVGASRSVAGIAVGSSSGALSLTGSQLTLGATGITANSGALTTTISNPIVLGSSQTWTNDGRALTVSGPITVANGINLGVAGSGDVVVSGYNATGLNSSIVKTGTGTLTLSGTNTLVVNTNSASNGFVKVDGGSTIKVTGTTTTFPPSQSNRGIGSNRIGDNSAGNRIVVSGAGRFLVGAIVVGGGTFGGNVLNVSAPGAAGTQTMLINGNGANLTIGVSSSNNSAIFSNSSYSATTSGGGTNTWNIGVNAGANGNSLLVTGTGTVLTRSSAAGSAINVGQAGSNNSLTIQNGGTFVSKRFTIGNNGGANNFAVVDGPNSLLNGVDSQPSFAIGSDSAINSGATVGSSGNSLTIQNRGTATFGNNQNRGYNIGGIANANDNSVTVTGVGSTFTMQQGQPLAIGGITGTNNANHVIVNSTASGNRLNVSAGAKTFQNSVYVMGVNSQFNVGDGTGISEAEVRASTGNAIYGAGVVLFSATSTLNFDGGRLVAGVNGTLVSGSGTINLDGPAYVFTNQAASTISSQIAGAGSLTKEGTGTLLLRNAANHTGTTSVNAGTLTDDMTWATSTSSTPSGHLSSSSALQLRGGAFILQGRDNGTATVMTTAFWFNNSTTINVDSTTGLVAGQSVTSTGAGFPAGAFVVAVTGATTFTIDAPTTAAEANASGLITAVATPSTFTSSETVNGLILAAGHSAIAVNAGAGNGTVLDLGAISPNGGTVNLTLPSGTQSSSNGITTTTSNANGILGGYATVGGVDWATNSGGNVVAYAGYADVTSAGGNALAIGAATNVRLVDGGTVTPAGSGTTDVNSLVLGAGAAATTYAPGASDVLRLGANGGIFVPSSAGALTIGSIGAGTLTAGGADDTAGTIYLTNNQATTLLINSAVTDNGSGVVGVTTSGSGSVTLAGVNTYGGPTIVAGGTLVDAGSIGDSSAVTVSGPTAVFSIGGNSDTVASVVLDDGSITGTGGTLTSTAAFDVRSGTVSAILGGTAGLNKTTEGTVTLTGTNAYTGTTTVSAGTLAAGANNVLATGSSLVVNGATATFSLGGNSNTVAGVSLQGNGNITGTGTLASASDFDVRSGWANVVLTGNVGLSKTTSGVVVLTGANSYTGPTSIAAGKLVDQGPVGSGAIGNSSAVTIDGATAELNLAVSEIVASVVLDGGGSITSIGSSLSTTGSEFDLRSGSVSAVLAGASVGLSKSTSGTVTLSAENTYTGATTVTAGTLVETSTGFVSDSSALIVDGATAVFDLGANHNDTVLSVVLDGGGSITGSGTSRLAATSFDVRAGSVAAILDGVGAALAKSTSGTVVLSGANTYTGATTVGNGKLTIASSGSIDATSGVTISGGEFNYDSSTTLSPSVVFSGTGGTLSGTGTLASAVTVTAGNTIAPGNSIGTLTIDDAVSLGGTSSMEIDATASTSDTIVSSGALTYGGSLQVTNLSGTLAEGQSWDLFDFASQGGTFANDASFNGVGDYSGTDLPSLAGMGLKYVFTYSTGVLSIQSAIVAPTIIGVAPFVGPTSGGNTVVITGAGFTAGTTVDFIDGLGAVRSGTSVTVVSTTQIVAVAPSGTIADSPNDVRVTNSAGTATATDAYTYAVPSVTSVVVNGGAIGAKNGFGQTPVLAGLQSVVAQLEVTFNMRVRLDANVDGTSAALDVTSLAGSVSALGVAPSTASVSVFAAPVASTGNATDGYTQYVVTFKAGTGVNSFDNGVDGAIGNQFTTLHDGFYQLNAVGSAIHAGVSDTGANSSDKFWALYGVVNPGDINVNGALGDTNTDTLLVDGLALNDVYATFGSSAEVPSGPPAYNVGFDWNLDGLVDGVDLTHLYSNFGTVWKL